MFQGYYQAYLFQDTYLEPALTCIPTPGASKEFSAAWAATLRLITLF